MIKFLYAGLAIGWAATMIYEWLWCGGSLGRYITWAVVGLTAALGLFVSVISREHRTGRPRKLTPMIWFLLAALTCAMFYTALERTVRSELTHVPLPPIYIILFVDFFASGCYTWWRKIKGKGGR